MLQDSSLGLHIKNALPGDAGTYHVQAMARTNEETIVEVAAIELSIDGRCILSCIMKF